MYNGADQTSSPSPASQKDSDLGSISQQIDRFHRDNRSNDVAAPEDQLQFDFPPRLGQPQMPADFSSNYNQLLHQASTARMFQGISSSHQSGYHHHGGGMSYFPHHPQNRAMFMNNHCEMNHGMFSGLTNNLTLGMGINPMMFQGQPQDFPETTSSASSAKKPEPTADVTSKPYAEKVIKRRRKKPRNSPRRPLSAYNLFFKDERKRILAEIPDTPDKKKDGAPEITWPGKKKTPHGKIGFENLAKTIGRRWKEISPEQLVHYKKLAIKDLQRYADEMTEYEKRMKKKGQGSDDSEGEDEESEGQDDWSPDRKKTSSSGKSRKKDSSK